MNSMIEIRKFAVEKAVEIMGPGAPDKDVVAKSKEIETYVAGTAKLPEYTDGSEQITAMLSALSAILVTIINPPSCCNMADFEHAESTGKDEGKETVEAVAKTKK